MTTPTKQPIQNKTWSQPCYDWCDPLNYSATRWLRKLERVSHNNLKGSGRKIPHGNEELKNRRNVDFAPLFR
jgi:hypothetical protein